jgi:hypothetical protein
MRIYYKNAICGAGKTYGAIEYAINKAHSSDQRIAIIQPSKELIDQTYHNILIKMNELDKHVEVKKIYSVINQTECVTARIEKYLNDAPSVKLGQILLITHEAFKGLPFWLGKETWEIIFDEIPSITPVYPFFLEKYVGNFKKITKASTDDTCLEYKMLDVNDKKLAEECSSLKNEELNRYREYAEALLNPSIDVYCLNGQWDKISTRGNHYIECFGIIRPQIFDGYNKVTIMGAYFQDSMLYQVWSQLGVVFTENNDIIVRHTQHDIGNRQLNVWYFSERNWSKTLRNSIDCKDGRFDPLIPSIINVMGNDEFIWCANNDVKSEAIDAFFNGRSKRISNISHGINEHMGKHKVLALSALNVTPAHFNVMKRKYGIEPTEMKKAGSHQTLYQAIMRCSLRDPNATDPVTVVLPDRSLGEWFVKQFQSTGKIYLRRVNHGISALEWTPDSDVIMGRPPIKDVALTALERKRLQIQKKRDLVQKVLDLLVTRGIHESTIDYGNSVNTNLQPVEGSIIASIHAKPEPIEFNDNEHLISEMHKCWHTKVTSKNDNALFSPAKFVLVNGVETYRGLDNIESVNGIWLDQDGGTLTPEEMRNIFPQWRFISMNSYSGNIRYFFPTLYAMTKEAYMEIWDVLINTINAYGYSNDKKADNYNGIDLSKRTASSMFYLPCQAKEGHKSFWIDNKGQYIDPILIIEHYALPDNPEYIPTDEFQNPQSDKYKEMKQKLLQQLNKVDEEELSRKRQKAINEWRSAPAGEGDKEFFKLGAKLKKIGDSDFDIRTTLSREALYGKSPKERRAQIPSIMKSLR